MSHSWRVLTFGGKMISQLVEHLGVLSKVV